MRKLHKSRLKSPTLVEQAIPSMHVCQLLDVCNSGVFPGDLMPLASGANIYSFSHIQTNTPKHSERGGKGERNGGKG